MACVSGSGRVWVGLREWMVCAWFKKKIPFEKLEKQKHIRVHIRYVGLISRMSC